ncbi:alpha/beta-hydrolase [Rhodocollybia butyracea]|uniref:Alpha/beta-hydrolase n=1 Tax=Rhodocollybia butyracea TaxID=206335 RepID=A0A9P5Q2A4_9AGAR|nr:alpha/beta-hydrolase [Rhodocollybia butyracea]
MTERAPFGTWKSPITAEVITGNTANAINDVLVDAVTLVVYHIEGRPAEKGRCVLVETETGREIVPKEINVRTGVHEYGSGAAFVHNGIAYYSDLNDNRMYKVDVKEASLPQPVTPENAAFRYACFDVHPTHSRFLISILEDHSNDLPSAVANLLAVLDTERKTVSPVITGADFYAHPKFSPDGTKLVFQRWNHPNMPWDNSEIVLVDITLTDSGLTFSNATTIARDGSNSFPSWASNNTLCWVSDISGFINPWKYDVRNAQAMPILPSPVKEDFGGVMGRFCYSPYAIIDEPGTVAVWAAYRDGRAILYQINIETGEREKLESPYVTVECMRSLSKSRGQFTFLGAKVDEDTKVIVGSVVGGIMSFSSNITQSDAAPAFDPSFISVPRGISLKVPPNNDLLHVVYYHPHNPAYAGTSIDGEKPPCIVNCHGGPTSMAQQGLQWQIQYWTTRGFAWLDVNYGGSNGYGKEYMNRLALNWGVVDVEDCIMASQLLATPPYSLVDPKRMVIRGGSAGGFTVLNALCNSSNTEVYAAATSLYGVSDLLGLIKMTHKFESHYMFSLVEGSPQDTELFKSRSPINHIDKINRPLLILQGDIDCVVPKEQSEIVYESIKKRGGVVEYKLYPGEGHGFRKEETQCDALERELAFYCRVLGLDSGE